VHREGSLNDRLDVRHVPEFLLGIHRRAIQLEIAQVADVGVIVQVAHGVGRVFQAIFLAKAEAIAREAGPVILELDERLRGHQPHAGQQEKGGQADHEQHAQQPG